MSMAWMCHEGGTGKLYGKNSRVVGTMQPATGSTEEGDMQPHEPHRTVAGAARKGSCKAAGLLVVLFRRPSSRCFIGGVQPKARNKQAF